MAEAEEQELVEQEEQDNGAADHAAGEVDEESAIEDEQGDEKESDADGGEEEVKEGQEPVRRDPTEGMTPEQAVDYWRKQATHFKGDYYKEKTKRQSYEKQYGAGGLISAKLSENGEQQANGNGQLKTEYENVVELRDDILREAETRVERRMTYQQQMDRFTDSEAKARDKYGDQYGEFVTVASEFITKNPWMKAVLLQSKDGGEAVKDLALLVDPTLKDRDRKQTQSKTREDMAEKIEEATKKAVTLKGNGPAIKSVKKLAKDLTDDEMEMEIARVKGL